MMELFDSDFVRLNQLVAIIQPNRTLHTLFLDFRKRYYDVQRYLHLLLLISFVLEQTVKFHHISMYHCSVLSFNIQMEKHHL